CGGGRSRRRAGRRGQRLGRDPQGAGPRAGRHRPLRPLRTTAVGPGPGAGAPLGPAALIAAVPVGSGAGAGPGGTTARLPHGACPGDRRAAGRAGVGRPHRGDTVRPGGGRGAGPGAGGRGSGGGNECAAARRGGGPLALRPGGHGGVGNNRGPAHDRGQGAPRERPVNPLLPDEAVEFGAAAAKAFAALGGVDAARRAEEDPTTRAQEVAGALQALGTEDLDPRDGPEALPAAAALCEAAGRCALPYPVAATLLAGPDGLPFAGVADRGGPGA